jgi:membrane protease YdiL (CAAX protease family)
MAVGHVSAMALEGTLGKLPRQPIVEAFTENGAWSFRLVTIVGVVVVTPVFEELFYRGYLYGVTKRFSDRFFAALFSSLLFTIAHSGVITVIPILTLAVFLVLAYELSGSLWVPMVIHVLFNLANVVGMLLLPAAG